MGARADRDPLRPAIDWEQAYARLGRAGTKFELAMDPPPDQVAAVLRERARQLASQQTASAHEQSLDLVVFRRGKARYGIESAQTAAVLQASPTPLPGVPPFYLGVIAHRGTVCALVDIGLLFGLGPCERSGPLHAIVCAVDSSAIAIAADTIEGLIRVDASSLSSLAEGEQRHAAIRGLTADATMVIDGSILTKDARLLVDNQALRFGASIQKVDSTNASDLQ